MASLTFLNAGFDSIMKDLPKFIQMLPDIPFIDEQHVAMQKLRSPEGRRSVLEIWTTAVKAGEAADAKKGA
jgi:hypothetical protein